MGNTKLGRHDSILVEDTPEQGRRRRLLEQNALRYNMKVKVYSRDLDFSQPELHSEEEQYDAKGPLPHPLLSNRFASEPLTPAQRMKFENERRDQELEKQLRLNLVPSFSSAPKPTR